MKRFILSMFLLVGFSISAFSQNTEGKKDEKEITICSIKLIAVAGAFRYSYRYIIKTDNKGSLAKITQLGKDKEPRFVNYEDFIPCMKSWTLNPLEDYFVSFTVGTIGKEIYKNYILISNKTETIKINLPDIADELVVEEEKKQ